MKAYRIVNREDSQSLAEYLTESGQMLLWQIAWRAK